MIKVSKSIRELDLLANSHYHLLMGKPFELDERIKQVLASKTLKPFERTLFTFFLFNLKEILIGSPQKLIKLDNKISPLYQSYISKKTLGLKGNHRKTAVKKANEKIFEIFSYGEFISKADGQYAYDFTEKIGINVCVYCNRQYTFTLSTSDGKCRPTLDHFLDKGKHPYFALSFYNLIPSCYVCNSSFKNQKQFSIDQNLHPFVESMFDVLEFAVDIKTADFISGKKKDFSILLKPNKSCLNKGLIKRAEANALIFKIEDLYQGHKDYASEIIKKAYYYNKTRINELARYRTEHGDKLFDSKEEVIEFALGNYINEQKLGMRVLAKLTRDLAKDLGITKHI